MATINTVSSSFYTQLARTSAVADETDDTEAELEALTFVDVTNVRTFPDAIYAEPNIIDVNEFGRGTTRPIAVQSNLPRYDFELNYVPSAHSSYHALVNNGSAYTWRIRIFAGEPPASIVATTLHDDFYFHAQIVAFRLTVTTGDALKAMMTLLPTTEPYGPFTTS